MTAWSADNRTLTDEGAGWVGIGQNDGLTDDGQYEENAWWDCGPGTLATASKFYKDDIWRPDTIKDGLIGQNTSHQGTSEMQLSGYLSGRLGIPNSRYYPNSRGLAMQIVRYYIRDSRTVIALRYFDYIGSPNWHWVQVFGGDGSDDNHTDHLLYHNPWLVGGGRFVRDDTATFWSWMAPYPTAQQVCLIGIDRYRCINPAPPYGV